MKYISHMQKYGEDENSRSLYYHKECTELTYYLTYAKMKLWHTLY